MDDSEASMKKKHTNSGSGAPSRAEPDVSDVEPKVKTVFVPQAHRDGEHLTSTYTELNVRKDERFIDTEIDGQDPTYSHLNFRQNELVTVKDEDPPVASGPEEMLLTVRSAIEEREWKVQIGNRPRRLIFLLCLVTFALIVTVAGLSIHVSQIRQAKITSDRNFHELNSTLQSKIYENSHLNLYQRPCLKNVSALNSNLYDVKRMHNDLRHQFAEMETKYRSVNETKAQICELLTGRTEQECSEDWIRNEGGCYFISKLNLPFEEASLYCSRSDSNLLQINSAEEESFVLRTVQGQGISYWIGKCKDRKVGWNELDPMRGGDLKFVYWKNIAGIECGVCTMYTEGKSCQKVRYRFICENSAPLWPDIAEKIHDLCQQPMGPT